LAFLVDWIVLNQAGDAAGIITNNESGFWNWLFVEEIWRGMFGTEIPIALLFLFLLFLVPESPRWLMVNGKANEAFETMEKIGGTEQANAQLAEMKEVVKEETKGFKELLKPYLRRPFLIGIVLPMFSHLSGIAAIMYFAPNILNESIESVESSFLGAVLVGVVNCLFTFVAIMNIERYGRRKLLLIGVIGAAISLMGVGTLFAIGSSLVIIPLCSLFCVFLWPDSLGYY
jgi:SP family arabinose:H+ symporter-like MFS transporter